MIERILNQVSNKIIVSIVFSFRNEEDVLPELIRRTELVFEPLDKEYEIIFVNDNSTDSSLEILNKNFKRNNRIKIITMSRRFGVTPCVIAGLRYSKGEAVIYMDADLQDPPELIPNLIEKWEEGFEIVHTTRTKRKGENPLKLWLTRKAYSIINFLADIEIPQNTGDFKLLSRRAVDSILQFQENDPFMRGLSQWIGYNQTQLFYEREKRFAGETKYSLLKSSNPYKEFLRGITSFSAVPLYFALFLGFIVSFSAFIYLFYVVVSRLVYGLHLPGWPALMVSMLFLGGTILFTIGVLGIYIGKIHQEVKNRPKYIIDETIGI